MVDHTFIEKRVQELGTQILEEAKNHIPALHTEGGRRNALFDLCMKDKQAATQIFRFMDVFPSLQDDAVLPHLKEYLINSKVELGVLAPLVSATNIAPGMAVKTIRHFAETMAKSFIAGNTIEEGVQAAANFPATRSCTFDIVGEITTSKVDAEKYLQAYLHALDILEKHYGTNAVDQYGKPKINLSVKLSALYEHFDPVDPDGTSQHVRERLRPIFRKAKQIGAFINLDMEHFQYNALTNRIFMELLLEEEFREFPHAGAVVQAYLKSSPEILEAYITFAKKRKVPITIRLVKGAYWDHEVMLAQQHGWEIPVFTNKQDTDSNYEALAKKLLENYEYIRAAFGSHNARSLAVALIWAEHYKVDKKVWEIQKLYGVAEEIAQALQKMNIPVRDYVPCGQLVPAMGYFVRRLLENSSNEAFVRGLKKDMDITVLLQDPKNNHSVEKCRTPSPKKENVSWFKKIFNSKKEDINAQNKLRLLNGSASQDQFGFVNHPTTNFALAETHKQMEDALLSFEATKGRLFYDLYINGAWVSTQRVMYIKNPSRKQEIIGRVVKAETHHIQAALNAAKEAFSSWSNTSASERAQYLFTVADLMAEKIHELSVLIMYETGKPAKESYADVTEAIDLVRYYGKHMMALEQELITQQIPGEDNITFYQPLGIVSVISPWNFPLAILTGMASAALAAGNTVVMKPASATPLIAGALMKLFDQAKLPAGVLNYIVCESSGAELLVTSPDVAMIAFTGSEEVGKWIYEQAAKIQPEQRHFKNLIIETGGKNAIIIDESADIEHAVLGVVRSAFGYTGQKCSACSRVIVHEQVYSQFLQKLKQAVESLRVGDAAALTTDVGPVIKESAFKSIVQYIQQGLEQGGILVTGGTYDDKYGYFIQPTVIEITPANILAQEEVFGPVLAVMKAKTFEGALELANSTRFALTGGLYSRTPSHIEHAKRAFQVGNLYVNRSITGAIVGRQHFGGFKMSGLGSKAGGPEYLPRFMTKVVRTINQDRSGHIPNILEYVK